MNNAMSVFQKAYEKQELTETCEITIGKETQEITLKAIDQTAIGWLRERLLTWKTSYWNQEKDFATGQLLSELTLTAEEIGEIREAKYKALVDAGKDDNEITIILNNMKLPTTKAMQMADKATNAEIMYWMMAEAMHQDGKKVANTFEERMAVVTVLKKEPDAFLALAEAYKKMSEAQAEVEEKVKN